MPVDVLLLVFVQHSKIICSLWLTHGQYTFIPYDLAHIVLNLQGRRLV
jgi:hypothetical protein